MQGAEREVMSSRTELLAGMPVFGGLAQSTLTLISDQAEPVSMPAGGSFLS